MPTERQQINLRVPGALATKIRMVSRLHRQSVTEWAVSILQTAVEEEFQRHPLEELSQDLTRVAQRYLPGRTVGVEDMLELAEMFADEDTSEGIVTRHVAKPRKAATGRGPGARATDS